jgi:hypothetical protein
MHKLIAALTLSTSALAVTSIYLWTELRDARGQVESLSRASSAAPTPLARATHPQHGADPTASSTAPQIAAQAAMTSSPSDDAKARQKMYEDDYRDGARRKLAQLSDATMRAQLLEEWKEANLPNKARYARYLGISEADAEGLIDVLAVQYLSQSEAYARCTLQPPCDYQAVSRETSAAQQRALTDLLGAEKQQRFEQYTYTNVERQMVSHFLRDKIPVGSQLSDEQAEQFIDALAEERRLVETAIKQRGSEPFVYPMEGVAFTFQNNVFEPGNTGERLKEAADYNRRIHARAKAILTPQQLAAFEQMQEASIVGVKYWLRQQERDLATRTATSGKSR